MKNFIKYFLFFLALALIAYLLFNIFKGINEKDNLISEREKEIEELNIRIENSEKEIFYLKALDSSYIRIIDSLSSDLILISEMLKIQNNNIDSVLDGDSSLAIQENRSALRNLGIETSSAPLLTNYEMGWNAKFLRENFSLRLKINIYQQSDSVKSLQLEIRDQIIFEKDNQIESLSRIKFLADQNAESYKKMYEKTQSFFYDRFVIYGGYGIGSDGKSLQPGFQIGIGIKLYSINFFGD